MRAPKAETSSDAEMVRAIEVFVHGFSFTRSLTHPYLAERVGPLWVMRDSPRKSGDYRVEEYVAYNVPPEEIDRIARAHTRGRYAISVLRAIATPDAALRGGFKSLGYRLRTTEPLMIHDLARFPRCAPPAGVRIERVMSQEKAELLAKAARGRQILPEHLCEDAPLRQYVALADGRPVGWVRSIEVGEATWCSSMHVMAKFRRRGIARALLCRMLREDRAAGAKMGVLLASHVGARLYPVVGYRQIGTLLLYSPRK